MKNCINLTQHQVRGILNGADKLVLPVKPQPWIDEIGHIWQKDGSSKSWNFGMNLDGSPQLKNFTICRAPYQPGQVIYGREAWMDSPNQIDAYGRPMRPFKYSVDASDQFREEWPGCFKSPATMPKSAARIFLRIEGVEVKRCREMTLREMAALGLIENAEGCYPHMMDSNPAPWEAYHIWSSYWIDQHGQESWDRNDWVWLYSITKVDSLNPA